MNDAPPVIEIHHELELVVIDGVKIAWPLLRALGEATRPGRWFRVTGVDKEHGVSTIETREFPVQYAPDCDRALSCICDAFQCPAASMCARCNHLSRATKRDLACWAMLMELRADEGHCVTVLADNVDHNTQPNCAIQCNGEWTGWADKRFAANTLQEALEAAVAECRAFVPTVKERRVGKSHG